MKLFKRLLFITLPITLIFISSCKKKEDNNNDVQYEIKDFIWHGLNESYLWVDQVPKLSSSTYSNQALIDELLKNYSDPNSLFYDLLYQYGTVDKWSWIVDDYTELENYFQGISKSMGFEFDLARISGTDNIFGIVLYVVKGGPAYRAGLKRGDIFIKINNTQLTVNNYKSLLYNIDSYTMGFAYISGNTIYQSNKTMSLVAEEVHENPIFMDTVYTINSRKIGYLVYNGYMSDYDIQLNNVIGKFKTANIDKLIIDLRYNGGGSVNTAIYLGSMIYGTFTDKVFLKMQYNDGVQSYLTNLYGSDYFNYKFADNIDATDANPKTPINTLNLSQVFFITTGSTASASELTINSLKPYIDVVTVGSNTLGKYVGSITIKDYIDKYTVNPRHKWALQPIVVKIANKNGVSDYINGLAPTVSAEEDIANLKQFGDTSEILLKTAINYINGNSSRMPVTKSKKMGIESFVNSKQLKPHAQEMTLGELPEVLRRLK